MADEIKIELVADANGVIKAVQKIGPEAEKATKPLSDGIDKANKKSQSLIKTISKFGPALGAAAVIGSIKKIVSDFAEFETKIAEVNTLLPKTNKVTKETEKAIRDLSGAYGKDAVDLASAYYDVISAGSQDAAESLELLESATKAAVVGVTDVKTATGAILSVMNAYGAANVSATVAGQKLFAMVKEGRTTFPELASNIGDIVPLASQLGIGLDELGGFLAVSTRISGNTAKTVTQLSAAFNAVLKPTDEAKKIINALNKETGAAIDFSATALKEQGLQKFFTGILNATKGFKNQQEILSKVFTSTEALKGVLSVTGDNFDKVKASIDSMANSQDALDDGFNDINETLSTKLNKTLAGLKTLMAPLGEGIAFFAKEILDDVNAVLAAINKSRNEIKSSAPKSPGGTRDFLGRGAIQPETFSPEAAIPFQIGQEGVDPTGALIDRIVGMGSGDAEENPMMQFAVNTDAMSSSLVQMGEVATETTTKLFNVNKALGKTKTTTVVTTNTIKKETDAMGTALKNGLARTTSFAIQTMTNGLIKGQLNFQSFVKGVVGMLGDLAIQMGEMAILSGITMESIGNLTGTKAIIAGATLVALGTILKSFAGGGGGSSAPSTSIAAPAAGFDNEPTQIGPLADEGLAEEPGSIEKQQQVQLVVQGSIFQTEETGKQLLDILNDEFDAKGGRIAYA